MAARFASLVAVCTGQARVSSEQPAPPGWKLLRWRQVIVEVTGWIAADLWQRAASHLALKLVRVAAGFSFAAQSSQAPFARLGHQ